MLKALKRLTLVFTIAVSSLVQQVQAAEPIYTGLFSNKALKGYDAVSYFQGDGKPVQGKVTFTTEWNGANWYFVSQANLEMFNTNPEKYAPQYGGYCAWAVAKGKLVKGDPLVYTLSENKLYINYDKKVNNKWLPKKESLIKAADIKFPNLIDSTN